MKLKTKYKIDSANELYTLNYNIAYWLRLRVGAYQLYRFRVSLRPPKHIAYLALPNYYLSLSAFPFLRSIFLVIFLATKQSRKHAYLAFEVTALSLSLNSHFQFLKFQTFHCYSTIKPTSIETPKIRLFLQNRILCIWNLRFFQ